MNLKEKIQSGKSICGTFVNIPAICVAEMMGYYDYDYLWIDLEHSAITIDICYAMVVAAKSVGKEVIIRLPQNDLTYTKKILEMGPDGIIFPMVHNLKEAEKLLSYTLYPPYGTRGCGPQRAVRYGADDELKYYKTDGNICRFLQIENVSFIDDLEEISKNPYIDGFILGLTDLSGSINEIGDVFGENNLTLAKKAIDIATRHNKIVGSATFTTDENTLNMLHNMGIKMITCGVDYGYIVNGAKNTYEVVSRVIGK